MSKEPNGQKRKTPLQVEQGQAYLSLKRIHHSR
jgi:hypothetical protein